MPRKKRSSSPFELMDDDFDDNSSQSSRNGNPPIQRNAANARERARMRVLSSAFGRLKTKLPNIPADTKLSKLDTLRLATMYIKQLRTVIEGGGGGGSGGCGATSPTANGESMEGSLNNNSTNCYLNLHSGAQSMNWPFGFHHHLNNSLTVRSTSSSSLVNNSTNWCQNNDDGNNNNNNSELKPTRYEIENYNQNEQQHHHQQQQQHPSYIQHSASSQQNLHNPDNHWYSETPSPELDSPSHKCLAFDNSNQHEQQQQQQHHLSQLQPALTHSSSFHHLQHHFHQHHTHQQQQQQQPQHLHNGFVNSSNFQSTSIR